MSAEAKFAAFDCEKDPRFQKFIQSKPTPKNPIEVRRGCAMDPCSIPTV